MRIGNAGTFEFSAGEVCSGQSRLAEIRSGEHRAVEICLSEVGTGKVRSA